MRLPNDSNRHVIVGMTGSGKTHAAVHALSYRSWPIKPWLIYNFKDEELINDIPGAEHIALDEFPKSRKAKGIYVVHSAPGDYEGIDNHLMQAWERESVGVFVDEAYMLSRPGASSAAFRYILTQGRSKHVPVIVLSQRPSWVDRFVFTEASFIQLFDLTDARDWQTVTAFIRRGDALDFESLPQFQSYYYDVGAKKNDAHKLVRLAAAPDRDRILKTFEQRAPERKRRLFFV